MPSNQSSSPEQLKLPASIEEVTPSWLSSVLGQKVKAIELTRSILNASAGKLFFTLTYEEGNGDDSKPKPIKICIKGGFNPDVIERYADFITLLYKREADFFNLVAPKLGHMDIPKSYWAGKNDSQGLVIMEDLAAVGAEFGEPVNAWPVDRVMAGVTQLAGLHAAAWGKHTEYPWADPEYYDGLIWALASRWDDLILGENRPPLPDILKDEKRIKAALKKHYSSRNPRFLTLQHGDPHLGNTYLIQGEPRFLDWQGIQMGSTFHDVAYFISGSLTVEDRKAHEMRILDHYLGALSRFGGPSLSRDDEEVMVEYRKSMMSGFNWLLAPYELQNEARVRAMVERHSSALVDHKAIELLESLPDV
ncbi:kinase-like domain-containing protein [Hypoxylon trugodes]|uniref:kinase-like domain-containing protein n=1 Tax=Hypoxylon trugodes TaxID=326681 RepID=UPI00219FFE99|nr:kinase-like domain-containing protein [Hypoxylon trugodes]KAI1389005.1 kinase-like domain-containing protein [Hypoxylon trugodes]